MYSGTTRAIRCTRVRHRTTCAARLVGEPLLFKLYMKLGESMGTTLKPTLVRPTGRSAVATRALWPSGSAEAGSGVAL
jgi:hypothetical protein